LNHLTFYCIKVEKLTFFFLYLAAHWLAVEGVSKSQQAQNTATGW